MNITLLYYYDTDVAVKFSVYIEFSTRGNKCKPDNSTVHCDLRKKYMYSFGYEHTCCYAASHLGSHITLCPFVLPGFLNQECFYCESLKVQVTIPQSTSTKSNITVEYTHYTTHNTFKPKWS